MKRSVLYILLIVFIGEATSLFQFVKLPFLYEHYNEHRALNPKLVLTEFLAMHYWGDDMDDSDDEKDMQLPFRHFDGNVPSFLFIPTNKFIVLQPQEQPVKNEFALEQFEAYSNPAGRSLFRPPKV